MKQAVKAVGRRNRNGRRAAGSPPLFVSPSRCAVAESAACVGGYTAYRRLAALAVRWWSGMMCGVR